MTWQANNAYHLLVGLPFTGSVVCPYVAVVWQVDARHHLLCDSFTHALPLLSLPVLSAFTLIPSTISHL